jgi:hypothetical protein
MRGGEGRFLLPLSLSAREGKEESGGEGEMVGGWQRPSGFPEGRACARVQEPPLPPTLFF